MKQNEVSEKKFEEALKELQGLIVWQAKRFQPSLYSLGAELDDLIQVGKIVLLRAMRTYSEGHKASFRTWFTQCLENEFREMADSAKVRQRVAFYEDISPLCMGMTSQPVGDEHLYVEEISARLSQKARSIFMCLVRPSMEFMEFVLERKAGRSLVTVNQIDIAEFLHLSDVCVGDYMKEVRKVSLEILT